MPLFPGKSRAAFQHNVSAEVHAGKPIKQAVAIAYSKKGEKMNKMAMGGMSDQHNDDMDSEMLMEHMSKELIHSVHTHDHEKFKNSFRAMLDLHHSAQEEEAMKQGNGEE